MFLADAKRCVVASIDDFYLSADEQLQLADLHRGNPLLEFRGSAGSHNVDLLKQTLEGLRSLQHGQTMSVPVYDKALNGGRGDRLPPDAWSQVQGEATPQQSFTQLN